MPATINLIGSELFDADSLSNISTFKISGSGGTPSAAVADGAIEGLGAVTVQTNKTRMAIMYDLGAGNTLDFTGGGANEGEVIGVWAKFLADGLLDTQANGGFGLYLASSLNNNYALFYHYGNDNYDGKPVRLVADPTKTRSAGAGTLNLAAIRYVGVFADVAGQTARFDNLVMDAGHSYKGYRITGTSTMNELIKDILDYEATNKIGILQALDDEARFAELWGVLELGDSVSTASTTITDTKSKIALAAPRYYQGGTVQNAVANDFFSISAHGNTTGTTNITIGENDSGVGRNGMTLIGSQYYDASVNLNNANVDSANLFGCTLEQITGTIDLCSSAASKNYTNAVSSCGTINQNGSEIDSLNIAASQSTFALKLTDLSNAANIVVNTATVDGIDLQSIAHVLGEVTLSTIQSTGAVGDDAVVQEGTTLVSLINGSDVGNVTDTSGDPITISNPKTITVTNIPAGLEIRYRQGARSLRHVQNVAGGTDVYSFNFVRENDIIISIGGVADDGTAYERDEIPAKQKNSDQVFIFGSQLNRSYK